MMFSSPVSISASSLTSRAAPIVRPAVGLTCRAEADLDPVDAGHRHLLDRLDRRRQMILQARRGRAHELAEARHQTLLVRLDRVDAAGQPEPSTASAASTKPLPPDSRAIHRPGNRLLTFSWLRRSSSSRSGGCWPPPGDRPTGRGHLPLASRHRLDCSRASQTFLGYADVTAGTHAVMGGPPHSIRSDKRVYRAQQMRDQP